MRYFWVFALTFGLITGCVSATYHQDKVQGENVDRLTVGKVQKEIRVGMTSAQVVEVLGSPNIVTTDEERREVWAYDKVATDVTYSQSHGYATLILIGTSRPSGSSSSTQRTLTVVVKFDQEGKVRDFSYHSSQF
ncbi:outer membrane protein assembly factor BamE [Candidatus Peregrinibacteria bacterium]|nr:outer membrane protein assembly factor BamE [Candidatus Peregrinibacteria bacterium]